MGPFPRPAERIEPGLGQIRLRTRLPVFRQPEPLRSHSFDTGAAWAMLSLQALRSGYLAHAMGGVDFERAVAELGAPAGFRAEAAVAIGKRANPEDLPDHLRAREVPNRRKDLSEVAFAGSFPRD